MKALIAVLICGAALLAQAPVPPKKSATPAKTAGKATSAAPSAALMNPAALKARAPELYRVKFTTTKGDFVVEVNRAWAPIGADRFYNLVRNKFFTDAHFFRVVPNFIVQFGIPANPRVARVWENANIKDDPVKQSNKKASIVFATAGPNTRTTQFFINLRDNGASLDKQGFAPFGTVTEGMEIVEGLYSGYGDDPGMGGHGPRQELVQSQGKAYLDKNFPRLDSIKSATIIFPEPSAAPAAAKKAAPSSAPKKAAEPAKK
jgi:peptidyl-prolyl cis-trans isomerase A (cyclophilin A)